MYEKERDRVQAYLDGKMSRRELLGGMSALGASAALTGTLVGLGSTRAFAAGFRRDAAQGHGAQAAAQQAPYTDALLANLDAFKAMTSMEVTYDIFPEDVYFDKVTAALSSRSSEYDVFWYQVGTDLGAGASAMIFDADILGYFMNGGSNKEAGNITFAPFAANPAAQAPTPNVWVWSLSMSSFSQKQDAAWHFMQWATGVEHGLFGAQQMDFVNPVRQAVWNDDTFRARIDESYPGYLHQHDVSAPGAQIYFTAQPLFFDLTTEWAATLQKMVANETPVDEGLDMLAESVNSQLADAGLR